MSRRTIQIEENEDERKEVGSEREKDVVDPYPGLLVRRLGIRTE